MIEATNRVILSLESSKPFFEYGDQVNDELSDIRKRFGKVVSLERHFDVTKVGSESDYEITRSGSFESDPKASKLIIVTGKAGFFTFTPRHVRVEEQKATKKQDVR